MVPVAGVGLVLQLDRPRGLLFAWRVELRHVSSTIEVVLLPTKESTRATAGKLAASVAAY